MRVMSRCFSHTDILSSKLRFRDLIRLYGFKVDRPYQVKAIGPNEWRVTQHSGESDKLYHASTLHASVERSNQLAFNGLSVRLSFASDLWMLDGLGSTVQSTKLAGIIQVLESELISRVRSGL